MRDDDTLHRKFVERFYNRQWDNPSAFELVLDTGALSSEAVVQQIVADSPPALEQQGPGENAVTTAAIKVILSWPMPSPR